MMEPIIIELSLNAKPLFLLEIITSPITIEARAITIAPVPTLTSVAWPYRAYKPPDNPTSPLLIINPNNFIVSVLIPSDLAICSLLPVALIDEPISVPKNQYNKAINIITKSNETIKAI